MLNVIGGTYFENCIDPPYYELYGSGLRAAAALSKKDIEIHFYSCIGNKDLVLADFVCKNFGIKSFFSEIERTVQFDYYHPLSKPIPILNESMQIFEFPVSEFENVLYYGMIEANAKFKADYVVYDPQNHKSFKETGSIAKHLALILNKKESLLLSGLTESDDLKDVGRKLIISEQADIIVIKNGSQGALVFEGNQIWEIPVFETSKVWPIGSGDIFSAVFAWKWMIEKTSVYEAAYLASKFTAQYCQFKQLPLQDKKLQFEEIKINIAKNQVYLAGPFFSISERWLINELRNALLDFGNNVFSPYHDIGLLDSRSTESESFEVVRKDIENLEKCDVVLAVATGLDAGTLFEIGYARSLNKKVVVLVENVGEEDLTMFRGTGCEIINDFSTAVYKASW